MQLKGAQTTTEHCLTYKQVTQILNLHPPNMRQVPLCCTCARLYAYAYNLNRRMALLHKDTTQYGIQYK